MNAHTIKGAARILHFHYLAHEIHHMEAAYSGIIRDGEEIDRATIIADAKRAKEVLNEYKAINFNKLNRDPEGRKVSFDRDFIEEHFVLLSLCINKMPENLDTLASFLREHSETITKIAFEEVSGLLEEYRERAATIAKDLEKEEPQVIIDSDRCDISPKQRSVIDNCMIHVLRNAMDHGIESSMERLQKGKNSRGMIEIKSFQQNRNLVIEVTDDGRGLAISKLHKRGLEIGYLEESSTIEDVADTIFLAGISTAETLSQISGRGVGMEAIKTFLEGIGGDIEIINILPQPDSKEYWNFTLRMTIPLTADEVAA